MLDVELNVPGRVVVAGGAAGSLSETLVALGIARPLVVTDRFLFEHGPVAGLVDGLRDVAVYADVRPDPTTAEVAAALAAARGHEADGLVAIGGGSSIDTAKAAAIMSSHEGAIGDYAGYHRFERAGLPVVALPTTAGTGSEVTRVTVITEAASDVKMMLLDNRLLPAAALVDYRLTLSCPPALTAHVGVDSLTHAIEAYVSRRANPVTDLWALEAARLLGGGLRRAFHDGSDEEARAACALGATLAGLAFSNASVALVHGMSRPIGAHFHLAHGLSNAVLLPVVTAFGLDAAPGRYAELARVLGVADAAAEDEAAARALVEELERLNAELGIPRLRELGVDRVHFDRVKRAMAEAALASGSPGFNPRVPSADEIVALYDAVY